MSSSFIQAKSFTDVGTTVTFTLPAPVTTGSNVLVFVDTYSTGATVTGVSHSAGNSYVSQTTFSLPIGGVGNNIAVFLASNVTGGTLNIQVAGSGFMLCICSIMEYSSGTMTLDQQTSVNALGVNTLTTPNVTTLVNDEALIAFAVVPSQTFGSTYTAGAGYTVEAFLVENSAIGSGQAVEDQIVSSTGSYNASISWGGGARDSGMILVTFSLSGAPPPPTSSAAVVVIMG